MLPRDLLSRFEQLGPELRASRHRIELRRDGDRVVVQRAVRHVERVRRLLRVGGGLGVAMGIALAVASPWLGLVAVAGVVLFVIGPRRVRPSVFLAVEPARDALVVLQPAAGEGEPLKLSAVTAVAGRYEVYGWEPRSVVYAERDGAPPRPVLVLAGTDEALAAFACRVLGCLLDVPASYAGPFGTRTACFTPATRHILHA